GDPAHLQLQRLPEQDHQPEQDQQPTQPRLPADPPPPPGVVGVHGPSFAPSVDRWCQADSQRGTASSPTLGDPRPTSPAPGRPSWPALANCGMAGATGEAAGVGTAVAMASG